MNKTVLGIIITVIAVGGIAAVVVVGQEDDANTATNGSTQTASAPQSMESENPFTKNSDMSTADVQSGEVKLDIKDFAFSQKTLKIKKGTKVIWTNQDSAKHDITPDTESDVFKASKLLAKGESYENTFATAGTYTYICSPHPYMKASIEVTE